MAKTKISEFSATPANNTDIDSINIAEGCAPSGINDAIRELMAQLKDFQTGAVGDSFNGPVGTSTAAAGAFTTLSASSTTTLSGLTASTALALDASKNVVSVTNTGTGNNVLATSPTLVTPILGTPTSATLTNATGLPISTGVSGLGTGVATFLATPSSANLAAALTDETGSGANVFATSPTLVTPILGTPTSATLTNATGLPLTTGVTGTLPTANGGTNLSSFTANGVVYASSSSALATGSALTFDGTKFTQTASTTSALAEFKNSATNAQSGNINAINDAGTSLQVLVFGSAAGTYGMLTASSPALYTTADDLNLVSDNASGVIKFGLSGAAEQMRLTSTGLGIGTSSPAVKLDVVGAIRAVTASTAANSVRIGNTGNSLFLGVDSSTGGTNIVGSVAYATTLATNTAIQLSTNNGASVQATFNQSGNLGIGTSSPDCRLMLETPSGTACQINLSQSAVTNYRLSIPASTDALTFVYGASTERMRLDSAGNLGLGVTPSAWDSVWKATQIGSTGFIAGRTNAERFYAGSNAYFNGTNWIYVTTGRATYYASNLSQHEWYNAGSGTAGNTISFTQAMTLDASGNLVVGRTSAGARLDVQGTTTDSSAYSMFVRNSVGNAMMVVRNDGQFIFGTGASDNMILTASGNLLVGTTSLYGGEKLSVLQSTNNRGFVLQQTNASNTSNALIIDCSRNTTDGTYKAIQYFNSGAGAEKFVVLDSGNVQNTNNSYGALSDAKLKENVTDTTPKLEKLNQVRVVNFNMIGDSTKQIGVIAQELETVFPSMVEQSTDRDAEGNDLGTTTKSVKYSVFVPMLIKSMQEQQAIIESLKARLDAANL